ncbi:MAG: helix-turn-helix domain-containing protein [Chitinivibrionales bacterium]|nr:helix-turn-helix domain-containing protein [Chitinivibrionales bacterium]
MAPSPRDEIMTMKEVAEYLKVSVRTVHEWTLNRKIPSGKIGTSWRYKRSEIERWVDERLVHNWKPVIPPSIKTEKIFSPSRILFIDSITKADALNELIDVLSTAEEIAGKDELAQEIFHREHLMSTAIGLGVAVPHVRLQSVSNLVAAVGISTHDITDYESLDDKSIRIIVMVAGGKEQHSQYLRLLAYLSSLLKRRTIRDKLLNAGDVDSIYRIIISKERSNPKKKAKGKR